MSKERQVVLFLLILIFLLWVIKSIVTINLYFDSFPMSQNEEDQKKLQVENMDLREKLLEKESYTSINAEARKRGFINSTVINLLK